jgi:hypothetical protein
LAALLLLLLNRLLLLLLVLLLLVLLLPHLHLRLHLLLLPLRRRVIGRACPLCSSTCQPSKKTQLKILRRWLMTTVQALWRKLRLRGGRWSFPACPPTQQ